MKKIKITIAYFVILTFVVVFSTAKAESFDADAISQVSKGIAEWKLMNEDKSETYVEQTVYVSSSLKGIVEMGESEGITVVQGLAAFDSDYDWVKRDSRIATINAGRDTGIGIGLGPYGSIYSAGTAIGTMWNMSNAKTSEDFYHATRGTPVWGFGVAPKILENIKIPEPSTFRDRVSQNSLPTFKTTWETVEIGKSTYKYPSIDWSNIPKTNWTTPSTASLPTYTPSTPKISTYTPSRLPSYSGRKY